MTRGDGVKTCPFCAETIKAAAVLCRFCAEPLPEAQALGAKENPAEQQAVPTAPTMAATTACRSVPTGETTKCIGCGGFVEKSASSCWRCNKPAPTGSTQQQPYSETAPPPAGPLKSRNVSAGGGKDYLGWVVAACILAVGGLTLWNRASSAQYLQDAAKATARAAELYKKTVPELSDLEKCRKTSRMLELSQAISEAKAIIHPLATKFSVDLKPTPRTFAELESALAAVESEAREVERRIEFWGRDPFGKGAEHSAKLKRLDEDVRSKIEVIQKELGQ